MNNIIIGIDPGFNITGWGILKINNNKINYINSGYLNLKKFNYLKKLKYLYSEITKIIKKFNPNCLIIEKIFIGKNNNSFIKLCYAKSTCLLSFINYNKDIKVFEYTYTQVRKYTLYNILTDKYYTQFFIKNKFNLDNLPNPDEADALAIAITHYNYINKLNN